MRYIYKKKEKKLKLIQNKKRHRFERTSKGKNHAFLSRRRMRKRPKECQGTWLPFTDSFSRPTKLQSQNFHSGLSFFSRKWREAERMISNRKFQLEIFLSNEETARDRVVIPKDANVTSMKTLMRAEIEELKGLWVWLDNGFFFPFFFPNFFSSLLSPIRRNLWLFIFDHGWVLEE